ncbi:MAG: YbaN family protein [Rhodocyclaceae bacterium]|nr:YbaN family protein [Rhodocyclaceae bacterium]
MPSASAQPVQPEAPQLSSWQSRGWRVFGAICVAIGIVNAFIPVLPTTIFLIVGAWAWGKGAPEWRARLLAHPRYGPALRLWLEQRMITRRGKRLCVLGLAASLLLSGWMLGFRPLPTGLLAGLLGGLAVWISTRPEPREGEPV